jgi:hypothetical protein
MPEKHELARLSQDIVHNTNLHKFPITTTHRVHSIAKTFIDHRLSYVSYSNCKIVLQKLVEVGNIKL